VTQPRVGSVMVAACHAPQTHQSGGSKICITEQNNVKIID